VIEIDFGGEGGVGAEVSERRVVALSVMAIPPLQVWRTLRCYPDAEGSGRRLER